MLINKIRHAISLLMYVLPGKSELELKEMLTISIEGKRTGWRMDERKFWTDVILANEESRKYVIAQNIRTYEELVQRHDEWKLKYRLGYSPKNIMIDYDENFLKATDFMD